MDTRLDDQHSVPSILLMEHQRRPQLRPLGHLQQRPLHRHHQPAHRRGRGSVGKGRGHGEQPKQQLAELLRQQQHQRYAPGEPQAEQQGTQRDAPCERQVFRDRQQESLPQQHPSLPAADTGGQGLHLSDQPLQPDPFEELQLCRSVYLQRAALEGHLPAVQL